MLFLSKEMLPLSNSLPKPLLLASSIIFIVGYCSFFFDKLYRLGFVDVFYYSSIGRVNNNLLKI